MHTQRPFQVEGTNFIAYIAKGRALLGDEMGLGKTGQVYKALEILKPTNTLVICGKNAQYAWAEDSPNWGHKPPIVIEAAKPNKPETRKALWDQAQKQSGVWTVTREVFKRDLSKGWVNPSAFHCIVVDEVHKDCNRKTQNFDALKKMRSRYLILLTGNKLPPEKLWAPLHLLYPKQFGSYWRFVNVFCNTQLNEAGYREILGPKESNLPGLHKQLSTIMIARTKKQVRPDMPPKTRIFKKVDLDFTQRKLYTDLSDNMITELSDTRLLATPTALAKIVRLRQCLVSPKLLDPELPWGASIEGLVELLDEASDKHMVTFCPFREGLSLIRHRLILEGYERDNIVLLHGGLTIDELRARVKTFVQRRGIALVTIRFAESFNLVPATWAAFVGSDWEPNANWQAEDRLHRGEIVDPIYLYYLINKNTIDETLVFPALNDKASSAKRTVLGLDDVRRALLAEKKGSFL